jgi:hypothetical protein
MTDLDVTSSVIVTKFCSPAARASVLAALLLVVPLATAPGAASLDSDQQPPASPKASGGPQPRNSARQDGPRPGSGLIDDLRFFWWRDADVKRELGLSEPAAKAIDTLFRQREQESRPFWQKYVEESRLLERMTREGMADIEAYRHQVQKVDALRSMLDTSRAVMIYSMFKELRPDQFEKLKQIAERRGRDRGRAQGSGR